jgi:hypothetical protein
MRFRPGCDPFRSQSIDYGFDLFLSNDGWRERKKGLAVPRRTARARNIQLSWPGAGELCCWGPKFDRCGHKPRSLTARLSYDTKVVRFKESQCTARACSHLFWATCKSLSLNALPMPLAALVLVIVRVCGISPTGLSRHCTDQVRPG